MTSFHSSAPDFCQPQRLGYQPGNSSSSPLAKEDIPLEESPTETEGSLPRSYSTPATPFWSPIGALDTVPLTPWPYPYTAHTPAFTLMDEINVLGHKQDRGPYSQGTSCDNDWNQPNHPQQSDSTAMPPPATQSSFSNLPSGKNILLREYTGLSPIFAGFSTTSPGLTGGPKSATTQTIRPGPMRGYSCGSLPNRRRSSTLLTTELSLSSMSPSTPPTSYTTYPYPSPRSSSSSSHSQTHYSAPFSRSSGPTYSQYPPATDFDQTLTTPTIPPPLCSINYCNGMNDASINNFRLSTASTPARRNTHSREPSSVPETPTTFDAKPPRFRPTREQLDILITAYEENKNPDAKTRENLATQLGPDVRPKTLQIWFQNRRSKARAKERELNLPKTNHSHGRNSPDRGPTDGRDSIDLSALRAIMHDNDPTLLIVPLTVLSISCWTRFLTPGIGLSAPDLGCAMSLVGNEPRIYLFVVHKSETFRVTIPVTSNSLSNLNTMTATNGSSTVALSFVISGSVLEFASWSESDDGLSEGDGRWIEVGDFTGGEASYGGRCELTGDRELLLPAYTTIQSILTSSAILTPTIGTGPMSLWRFPSIVSDAFVTTQIGAQAQGYPDVANYDRLEMELLGLNPRQSHTRQRSFSAPEPVLPDMAEQSLEPASWSSLTSPEIMPQQFAAEGHGEVFGETARNVGWNPFLGMNLDECAPSDLGREDGGDGFQNFSALQMEESAGVRLDVMLEDFGSGIAANTGSANQAGSGQAFPGTGKLRDKSDQPSTKGCGDL